LRNYNVATCSLQNSARHSADNPESKLIIKRTIFD
jgi:hypothetical protein